MTAWSGRFTVLVVLCSACGDSSSQPQDCFKLSDGTCVVETFANPPVLQPDGDGVYTLRFGPAEVTLDGQRHCVRAYNGTFPGPTIDVAARAGSEERQVRVNLINSFTKHDHRSLEGGACTCVDGAGDFCHPHGSVCDPPPADCVCVDDDGNTCEHVYDFNLTNLHFHGGHVEPDYANGGGCVSNGTLRCRDCDEDVCDGAVDDGCFFSDDVIAGISAGTGSQHRFDLDEDGTHHEGLFWYHPHIHGSTAIQVASGSVGALIVRGDLDEVAGVKNARERIVVFSTPSIAAGGFEPMATGATCTEDTLTFNEFSVLGDFLAPQRNVINGLRRPRMLTAPGQVERWRIVHAAFLDEVWLGLFKGSDSSCSTWTVSPDSAMTLRQIARDGITLPQVVPADYVFMSPGYRVEAVFGGAGELVDGDTWCLVAGRFLQAGKGPPMSPPTPPTPEDIEELLSLGDLVAILNVAESYGAPTETTLPSDAAIAAVAPSTTIDGMSADDRCAAAAAIQDPAQVDQVAILQVGFWTADEPDPCGCDNYNVNCQNFGETDRARYPYDRDLVLGAVEHWRVSTSVDGHPFHIHTNPVLLCPSDNVFDPIPFPHWRDTYLVNLTRKVDMVMKYSRHTGAHVLHCHKLTHEDEGMMELIRVCDPTADTTCGDHTWRTCDTDDLACIQKLAATDCALTVTNPVDAAMCSAQLGGPMGVCGMNACLVDADCPPAPPPGLQCVNNVCQP